MTAARLPLVLLLLAFGFVAGCDEDDPCAKMAGLPDGGGATVLLSDVSASARSGGEGPDYAAALRPYLTKAIGRGDRISIGSFDGSSATVRWEKQDEPTLAKSKRPENQESDREDFAECLNTAVRAAADRPAGVDRTDIQGALGVAAWATTGAKANTVVLATDGLSTTGCLDLTSQAAAGDPRWIDDLMAACPEKSDWPAVLAGKNLVMVGIGQPADGERPPATGSVEFLRRLWQQVCTTARALSCDISTAPVGRRDAAKSGRTDPPVRFVESGGAPPISDHVVTLSSEELFDTDSATLRPGVAERLRPMIESIAGTTPASVEVVGHTDTRASDAHNQDLSERRAAAVAALLTTGGLSGVSSRGVGETGAGCTRERLPGGAWNEPCLQRDRRVDVVVKTTRG